MALYAHASVFSCSSQQSPLSIGYLLSILAFQPILHFHSLPTLLTHIRTGSSFPTAQEMPLWDLASFCYLCVQYLPYEKFQEKTLLNTTFILLGGSSSLRMYNI